MADFHELRRRALQDPDNEEIRERLVHEARRIGQPDEIWKLVLSLIPEELDPINCGKDSLLVYGCRIADCVIEYAKAMGYTQHVTTGADGRTEAINLSQGADPNEGWMASVFPYGVEFYMYQSTDGNVNRLMSKIG